jgi:glutathione S-transferase
MPIILAIKIIKGIKMRFYTAPIAPNPLRVEIFMKEKQIQNQFEFINVELSQESKSSEHLKRNRLGQVPVLELDDGRFLSESRAICTYLEGLFPEPNLMGINFDDKAFIEMHDRQVEHGILYPIYHWVRHTHPGLAKLEGTQISEWAQINENRAKRAIGLIDIILANQEYVAGDNFTIADISLYCGINFARIVKFKAWEEFENIAKWREKLLQRESFK